MRLERHSTRVVSDSDRSRVEHFGRIAAVWFDYCGILCYGADSKGGAYEKKAVHSTLDLDRVLSQVNTALRAMP